MLGLLLYGFGGFLRLAEVKCFLKCPKNPGRRVDRGPLGSRIVRNCKYFFHTIHEYVPCLNMFHSRSYSENHTCLNDLVGVISWTVVLGNNDPGLVGKKATWPIIGGSQVVVDLRIRRRRRDVG